MRARDRGLLPWLPPQFHLEFWERLHFSSSRVPPSAWQRGVGSDEREHLTLLPGPGHVDILDLRQVSQNSLTSLEDGKLPKRGETRSLVPPHALRRPVPAVTLLCARPGPTWFTASSPTIPCPRCCSCPCPVEAREVTCPRAPSSAVQLSQQTSCGSSECPLSSSKAPEVQASPCGRCGAQGQGEPRPPCLQTDT